MICYFYTQYLDAEKVLENTSNDRTGADRPDSSGLARYTDRSGSKLAGKAGHQPPI